MKTIILIIMGALLSTNILAADVCKGPTTLTVKKSGHKIFVKITINRSIKKKVKNFKNICESKNGIFKVLKRTTIMRNLEALEHTQQKQKFLVYTLYVTKIIDRSQTGSFFSKYFHQVCR